MSRTDTILTFIRDELLDDDVELTSDTSLFESRILDSLNMLSLISFLEKAHSIKVATSEVNLDNLDTVTRILAYLDKKLA
jgi:acyl carrier protein